MSYLNLKIASVQSKKFNWDDIEVGNEMLDHSQNFFGQKHLKHERMDATHEMEMVNNLLASAALDDTIKEDNKENIACVAEVDAGIPQIKVSSPQEAEKPKPASSDGSNDAADEAAAATTTSDADAHLDLQDENLQDEHENIKPSKPPSNIAKQWSTVKPKRPAPTARGAIAKSMPPPPHAYECKDLYLRRKEQVLRQRDENERKMREFNSRPAPNFQVLQRRKPLVVHAATVPVTPEVLKKSLEMQEKRHKKLEEWKNKQPPKFEPRPAAVLNEEPFVPKKTSTVVQSRPFNLRSERRLQERKQYDVAVQRSLEEKKHQVEIVEEERRKREEEQVKELRKLATFKARPNPFK